MGNIRNYKFNKLDMRLSNTNYWDMDLTTDEQCFSVNSGAGGIFSGDCLVAHFDFNESDIYTSGITSADTIYSLTTWTGATNTGFTADTIGLTGIDNGLITFDKTTGDTSNQALLSALTASTLVIDSGDTRLCLNRVTGMTDNYIYPIDILNNSADTVGDYAQLCGGFYQGYYKLDGTDYQVLPDRVPKGWVAEMWVKRDEDPCTGYTGTTLNDDFPNNKGFFLYFGTRAENKFWNIFEGVNTGCTSGCTTTACTSGESVTTFCTPPKETDITIMDGDLVIPLSPPPIEIKVIDNQFLIYHRGNPKGCNSCGGSGCNKCGTALKGSFSQKGKLACNFTGGTITVTGETTMSVEDRNPFLVFHRGGTEKCGSCGGSGCNKCGMKGSDGIKGILACQFTGDTVPVTELDVNAGVIDNALGFRITDDGRIGYRSLKFTGACSGDTFITGVTVEEEYSTSGMVSTDEWNHIAIRFVADDTYDKCQLQENGPRKGRLLFYVNCKLKFIVEDFDEFIASRLNEYYLKQLAVPYNISLGGGSQGLLESMTFDGQDPDDQGLHIAENFAGTFIGGISQFRFYICNLDFCTLENNCDVEAQRYSV